MAVRSIGTIAVILNAVTTGFNRGMSLATTRLMQFGKAVKMMGAKIGAVRSHSHYQSYFAYCCCAWCKC